MPKTATAGMIAHLGQRVTSLASCWRVTRTDGEQFLFTSHDRSLAIDLSDQYGQQTYEPANSYRLSSMTADDSLGVDEMEATAILAETDGVDEDDLRRGLFDYARVDVFLVNWADLSDGAIKMRRGRFGEVTILYGGLFRAELRGLTQNLRQGIVRSYKGYCDADLGDSDGIPPCRVPIWPDEVLRSTAYSKNDYVRATSTSPRNTTLLSGTNLGFDTGDLTGWTTNTGTPQVVTGRDGTVPHDGSHMLNGLQTGGDYEVEQVIDLVATVGLSAAKIAAGDYLFNFWVRCAQTQTSNYDDCHVKLEWLTSGDALISTPFDEQHGFGGPDTWSKVDLVNAAVPTNAAKLRITLGGVEIADANRMTACFDSVAGEFSDLSGDGPREAYLTLKNPGLNWAMMTTAGSVNEWTVTAGPWQADDFHDAMTAVFEPFFIKASGGGGGDRSMNQVGDIPTDAIPIGEIDSGGVRLIFPVWIANHVSSDPDTYRIVVEALDASETLISTLRDTGDTEFTVWDEWVDASLNALLPSGTRKIRITLEVEGFNVFINHAPPYLVRTGVAFTADNYDDVIYRCVTAGTTAPTQPAYDATPGNQTTDGTAVFEAEEAWTRYFVVSWVDPAEPRRRFKATQFASDLGGSRHQGFADDWMNRGGLTFEAGGNAGITREIKDFVGDGGESPTEQVIELAVTTPFDITAGDTGRAYPGCDKQRPTCGGRFGAFVEHGTPESGLQHRGFPDMPGQPFLRRRPEFKPGTRTVG